MNEFEQYLVGIQNESSLTKMLNAMMIMNKRADNVDNALNTIVHLVNMIVDRVNEIADTVGVDKEKLQRIIIENAGTVNSDIPEDRGE